MESNAGAVKITEGNIAENFLNNWPSIVIIIVILLVVIIVIRVATRRIKKLIDKNINDEKIHIKKRTYTLTSVISNFIIVISTVVALIMIADQVGIPIAGLLAGAGVLGIIIGFGTQSLMKDLINGIFILVEQWYQVDDTITVGDISGTVEKFNLRTTAIRDLEGTLHFIPNGEIKILSNRSYTWARAVININVNYDENIDRVIKVLEEVFDEFMKDKKYRRSIIERPSILGDGGVSELGNSAVILTIICTVKAGEQWTIGRQLRKRIKDKFDLVGIEIPYPSTNVYIKSRDLHKKDK
ncbi:MAG: mechanosensitive ion channel family protein [Actinomycetota bacterium]|nr:mechanosensitive ion channel family protein [Actinomycetota bacterium]